MPARLDRHPVRVAVDTDQSEAGVIVFADGVLVAVLSCLKETVDGELQGRWYLEAGFGPCDGVLPHPTFNSQDDAEQWVVTRVDNRGRKSAALRAKHGAYPLERCSPH